MASYLGLQGRKVSFKNTLLIMTSNIGSTAIAKGGSNRIGFTFTDNSNEGKYAVLRSLVMEELKSYFRPELLNRLDDVVVFRSLEKSDVSVSAIVRVYYSVFLCLWIYVIIVCYNGFLANGLMKTVLHYIH